jgi:hypothetical protein
MFQEDKKQGLEEADSLEGTSELAASMFGIDQAALTQLNTVRSRLWR